MPNLITWIFQKISKRYDSSVSFALPEAWRETQAPLGERIFRKIFGIHSNGNIYAPTGFWHKFLKFFTIILYFAFLWFLYESYWAWDIFGGD